MKADLASIFSNFIFLVYFLKLICYILIFIQFKFFFFFPASQHAKSQFPNQGPKPWPLQWKLGDPATGPKSLSS